MNYFKPGVHQTKRILLSVTFWGQWHTYVFTDILLPSMLTPGNLPALAENFEIEFHILTTAANRRALETSAGFASLKKLASIDIVEKDSLSADQKFHIHHEWWNTSRQRAFQRDAFLGFIPPDICISDGTLA